MKYLATLVCGILIIVFTSFPPTVFAFTYGSSPYGSGVYGAATATSPSQPGAPGCSDIAPETAPWLYGAIPASSNSVLLYFTNSLGNVTNYVLEFGTKSGDYEWGQLDIGKQGTRTYLVESLSQSTKYYFRVRAGNGCATGPWSNEISATTKSLVGFNQLQISSELEAPTQSGDNKNTPQPKKTYSSITLNVYVVDQNSDPLSGVLVTVNGNSVTTNELGTANFSGLKPGETIVAYSHNGNSGTETINLSGDQKDYTLRAELTEQKVEVSPINYIALAVIVVFAFTALFFALRKFRKRQALSSS